MIQAKDMEMDDRRKLEAVKAKLAEATRTIKTAMFIIAELKRTSPDLYRDLEGIRALTLDSKDALDAIGEDLAARGVW